MTYLSLERLFLYQQAAKIRFHEKGLPDVSLHQTSIILSFAIFGRASIMKVKIYIYHIPLHVRPVID
jgi:hypothetical protein